MKWEKNFYKTDVYHLYQRSFDGGVIFYSPEDYLIFFSIINYYAHLYKVRLVGLCLMVNHYHSLVMADSLEIIRKFVQTSTFVYAKAFNSHYHKKGPLFSPSFGMSGKYGDKKIRTAISYLHNNPIEKGLCTKAENYRWNFLAYTNSLNPFSAPIVKRKSRFNMKKAIKLIDGFTANGKYLNYGILNNIYYHLNQVETEQITDYIISSFSHIDYKFGLHYYKDYSNMLNAINSNTGSEYDIIEIENFYSNIPYQEFNQLLKGFGFRPEEVVFNKQIDPDLLLNIIHTLLDKSSGEYYHIKRYFHMD